MKKQIVLLFLMFFTLLFSMPNINAKAYEIENSITSDRVIYSSGYNTLDINDFIVNGKTIVTAHSMYVGDAYQNTVIVRFCDTYYNERLKYKVHCFDVDGYYIKTFEGDYNTPTCEVGLYSDGIAYAAESFVLPISTFSVILEAVYYNNDFINNNYGNLKLIKGPYYAPYNADAALDDLIFQKIDGRLVNITNKDVSINIIYPNVLSQNDFKNMIKAYDGNNASEYEGISIEFDYDSYLSFSKSVGKHSLTFSASDEYGNTSTLNASVNIIDNEKPYLSGPSSFKYPINTELSEATIKEKYSASDNYDGDISNKIIISPEYTQISNEIKNETITISVTDSSNNTTTKSVTIEFYDNISPVIESPDEITVSYQVNLSLVDIIRNSLRVTDNIDSNVNTDIYSLDTGLDIYKPIRAVGEYELHIKAKDNSNNETTKSVKVIIEDKIPPVIFIDNNFVELTSGVDVSIEDLTNLLYANGTLKKGKHYKAKVLTDTYSSHKEIDGVYHLVIEYEDGEDIISQEFNIKVKSNLYTVEVYSPPAINKTTIIIIILSSVLVIFTTIIVILTIRNKRRNKESNGEL